MRNKVLRIKRRNGLHVSDALEVLSDGGKYVVQELPVTSIEISYQPHQPGKVLLELHADLIEVTDVQG